MPESYDGYKWTLGELKEVIMEDFCIWDKVMGTNSDEEPVSRSELCDDFNNYIWFKLGNGMGSNHHSTFKYHMKYINNDIMKPSRVIILQYYKHISEMHELDLYLPPPPKKGNMYDQSNWRFRDLDFTEDEIRIATK